jgi:drug/metabolite transporter (DMT)-like permease
MIFGGLIMLAAGTLLGEWSRVHLEGRGLWALTYLVFVGSIGGFVSYIYALQHLPVATVSLYAYANPLIAVVLGALLLGEPFTLRTVISMAIVFAGMALVRRKQPGLTGSVRSARVRSGWVANPANPTNLAQTRTNLPQPEPTCPNPPEPDRT